MWDIPRIELFARNKTKGWDVWGNEIDSDIRLDSVTREELIRRQTLRVSQDASDIVDKANEISSSDFEDLLV